MGSAKKPKAEVEQPSSEPIEIVVRRGALRRFDQLKQKSTGLPVQLTWDRRVNARRRAVETVAGDRRRGDRRQMPPFTWEAADFVVVGDQARSGRTTEVAPKRKRG